MAKAIETLPNRIRYWRKQRGLSQEQLGDRIGVSKQMVGHLETGIRPLNDAYRLAVARELAIDVADTYLPEQTPNTVPLGERDFLADYYALPAKLRAAVREHTRQLREWGAQPPEPQADERANEG
ncbi:helix-turn-helix domain-containing protein [Sphingomonas sp. MG17]|uniref:Helix-turn-helix domain-containing protein n=1 Tax=Sphingomonas tagetis TaxID=2949092 RepID=A0A9X2HJT3_9SPHN|nr:helix-turn-helix transcriptional regulator [Sphingomonas tagetis]MCP3730409.1 helix-turn-helix domain-containing protein [Sphingomonas tagetis]